MPSEETTQALPFDLDSICLTSLEKIGERISGEAHLVKAFGRDVAAKTIQSPKHVSGIDMEDIEETISSLYRKITVLQYLGRHPYIVQLIAAYEKRICLIPLTVPVLLFEYRSFGKDDKRRLPSSQTLFESSFTLVYMFESFTLVFLSKYLLQFYLN